MKNFKLRMAAVVAASGLLVTMAPLSAFAATEPTYPAGSDAPIYLLNNDTALTYAKGTQLDWEQASGVNFVSQAVTGEITDIDAVRLPSPTAGETRGIPFLTTDGTERTRSSWKAWSDVQGVDSNGVLLPSVIPGKLAFGTGSAVKTAGGSYSLGFAYLTAGQNDATASVSKVFYTTINVDAGTGTWKFATPTVVTPVVVTDVATSTTLAASPVSVEAGSTSVLTATVAASKPVTGNVEFFEGTTKIGTGAISAGTATKTVTVGSVGTHTYSAKFVENTVSTGATTSDKFLASTSADITVTGTPPTAPVTPNAPTENSLNANTMNGVTAAYDAATHKATMSNINANNEGKTVNVFGYSTPTYLGQQAVTGGTITVDVSTMAAGIHKLAITDPATGDVLGWASFTKSDAASAPTISKTINADVAAQTLADGEFSLTNLSGDTVNLTNPALVNGASVVSGELGDFKVTDLRQASKPGWVLKTDVAQFAKGTDTIAASALGIAPKLVSQAGTGATAPVLGSAQVSGSATYPWNFATLAGSGYSGVSKYNADLVFTAPAAAPAGTYTSTLTLTLISN